MDIKFILGIILSIGSLYVIYLVKKKTGKFSYATLTALGLGLTLGIIFKKDIIFLQTLGRGYMSLIKMIIVPLVSVSLITSVLRFKDIKKLKSIGTKTLIILLSTTGIGAFIGIVVAKAFSLGDGIIFEAVEGFVPREVPTLSQVIVDFLPSNPIAAIVDNKIIPIIIFSLFIAVALSIEDNKNPERVKPFKDFILATYDIVMRITKIVLQFIPYGIFGLIAAAAARNGIESMKSLLLVLVALYIACVIHMLIVHTPIVAFIARRNPIEFFKGIFPAQVVAFTSQSSYGTLPVTIKSLVENLGVSESVANFVAPLGSTVGMNACGGIYPAMVAIIVANVFGVKLNLYSYGLIIVTAIIASIGIAGVPGSATMATTVVLTTIGLPLEGIVITMAVDSVIDMMRTATNVTGSAVAAITVDALEKRKAAKKIAKEEQVA